LSCAAAPECAPFRSSSTMLNGTSPPLGRSVCCGTTTTNGTVNVLVATSGDTGSAGGQRFPRLSFRLSSQGRRWRSCSDETCVKSSSSDEAHFTHPISCSG
jgi:hypothetical protein